MRVSRCNPNWYEEGADQSERFKMAMDYAEEEFLAVLHSKIMIVRPAY